MTTNQALNLRIRTQSSLSQSFSGSQNYGFEHSFQSVSFIDQSVSLFIQNLHQKQAQTTRERPMISSKSHSYILVDQQQPQQKPKCTSMKKGHFNSLEMIDKHSMNQLLSYNRCLNLAKNDIYNRAYGAMFGFIIGDSLGAYVVNLPKNQPEINKALMMKGGGVMNLKSGECTDQWEICMALSEALLQGNGRYDPNLVALKYLEWLESQPFDLPVLMGIAFGQIRKKRRSGQHDNSNIAEQLIANSLRNVKQESNLGLVRLIPLVIWSLNLDDYQFQRLICGTFSAILEEMKLITPNAFVRESAMIYANILRCIITTGDHMLAYHQAAQNVYNFGSEQMTDLWRCIEEGLQPVITTANAKKLHNPFVFAVNEMLEIHQNQKDLKKYFIETAVKIMAKGFTTDTNCSIVLGMVGAVIGYNNIPSYFRSKIINSSPYPTKKRSRGYPSRQVVEIVDQLLSNGARDTNNFNF